MAANILDFASKKQTNTWYDTFKKSMENIRKTAVTYDQIEKWKLGIFDNTTDPKKPTGHLYDFISKVQTSKNTKELEDFSKKVHKDIKDTEEYLADIIGKRLIKQLDEFKRIEENRNNQLNELEKKRNDSKANLDKATKDKYDTLIKQTKDENEILKKLLADLESIEDKEQIASPQLQQFTDYIQKRKDLDKQVADESGVKTYGGMNLLESRRHIEDFLKDQRAHLKNKSANQIAGESKFNVSKMFYGFGQELGSRANRFLGKKLGKLEPFHEKLIDKYVDEYGKELEEDGTKSEEQIEKDLMAYEKNLRKNFSSKIRQKDILTETDTDKIKEVSRTGKNLYKGGTLDNDVNIVGEKGIEVIKGKDVYTPDGDKTNTGKWADTLKSMLGINRPGDNKDPILMHTIALRKDVLDIKKLMGDKFKYDTERDEDLDSLREKELKDGTDKETVKESKTDNKDILDSLKDLKSGQNNSLVDDLLIGNAISKGFEKVLNHIKPGSFLPLAAPAVTAAGVLGGTAWAGFDVISDAYNLNKKKDAVDYSQFDESRLYIVEQAKKERDKVNKEFEESSSSSYDISGGEGIAMSTLDKLEKLEKVIRSGVDKKGIVPMTETFEQWKMNKNKQNQPSAKPFAMGGDWKVTGENGIEFEQISPSGRNGRVLSPLNKSVEHRQSLKDVLKESFKELNGTVQNFNPTEFKNITFQLYKDTVAVLEKNLAKNNQAKENGRIAMINNNIMGNRNQEVVVKEKHIPVSSGDFVRIK
jgi:hypothetical protein